MPREDAAGRLHDGCHCGLPRLEDFCWIATQEPNVYGGLAVVMPFIHSRPKYFGQVVGELLYWIGEDRITFASDYAIWQPNFINYFTESAISDPPKPRLMTLRSGKASVDFHSLMLELPMKTISFSGGGVVLSFASTWP